jgi:hypothetical protein
MRRFFYIAIAFDADVLEWDLDDNPPNYHTRHVVKQGGLYGTESYTLSMKVKHVDDEKLRVNFIGIQERAMWPAKKKKPVKEGEVITYSLNEEGGLAMSTFARIDEWLNKTTKGEFDVKMWGVVAGYVEI